MIDDTGGIPTFCYCTHHVLDHDKTGCAECACPGFIAKAAFPWPGEEHALTPVVGRYDSDDLKEDSHG